MDAAVIASLAKWPNVPAVFGWLRLDRRGNWLIRDDRLVQPSLIDFINRNFARDERGRYFFQNGPQRVFAALDYTPWVLTWNGDALRTQGGETVAPEEALIDDQGNLLLAWNGQVGLLDDRDLPAMLGCLRRADGSQADETVVLEAIDQSAAGLTLQLGPQHLPVTPIRRDAVAVRFGFEPLPSPD